MRNIIKDPISATLTQEHALLLSGMKKEIMASYGENRRIAGGSYDRSLAAKCVNGTFVGRRVENLIVYRGILSSESSPSGRSAGKRLWTSSRMTAFMKLITMGSAPPRARLILLPFTSRERTACT